ncbi:hypothetical protein [Fodinibius sp.]|uniref:hypothetical protein n=1 Tax=Fodinibius sp. TaxID=1872440 RepID=UPI003564BBF9
MDRKESLKTLLLGTASWSLFTPDEGPAEEEKSQPPRSPSSPMRSRWRDWPDVR